MAKVYQKLSFDKIISPFFCKKNDAKSPFLILLAAAVAILSTLFAMRLKKQESETPKSENFILPLHVQNYRHHIMDVKQSMQEILEAESKAVLNIPITDAYEEAVKLIVEQVKHEGGKLVTSGMGKCGQIADNIATTFSSTGIPAIFLHPSEAQHGDLGVVQPHDVLLLLSNSGRTNEICALVSLAHNLYPQLKIVVITGNKDSELAHLADICLWTGSTQEVCPLGLTPTTSTTVMTVIGDVLVVNTMRATGFTREDYALRHHGGYLGSIAKGTNY